MKDVRDLLDYCSALLDAGPSDVRSERTTALIALDFCDLLFDSLDKSQRHAVAVARQFWNFGRSEEFVAVLKEFAKSIDHDEAKHAEAARNRLIWTALNQNTKFDEYACEFIVLLALDAGLKLQAVADVLANYLPGLQSWRNS